ncbi:MAG TPA: MarR family transcriptional regulator [Steroidobacteraceae bacterium]
MSQPYYTVENLQAGKSIGFLVKRCGGLMSQLAERRFAGEPVSFMQWMVMANLARFEHLTASALAAQICHDMGALTRIVDELEKQGLARRERSESDRRVVEITLTSEGRRHLQGGKRIVVEMLNSLVEPFSREELETLIGLMQRMMARLQEAEALPVAARAPEARRRRGGRKDAIRKRQSR